MGLEVEDLAFESEATNIAAKLYRPKDKDRAPVVVMAHGFTAVMEHLEPQARSLQAAGFAVLARGNQAGGNMAAAGWLKGADCPAIDQMPEFSGNIQGFDCCRHL